MCMRHILVWVCVVHVEDQLAWLNKVMALFDRVSSSPWLQSDTHLVVQFCCVRMDIENRHTQSAYKDLQSIGFYNICGCTACICDNL